MPRMVARSTRSLSLLLSLLMVSVLVDPSLAATGERGRTYTTDADFAEGSSVNVVSSVPDQLQLDDEVRAFDFLWVAVSTKGTIVKIDTRTGEVLGEYRTAPQGQPTDPSRTTVDKNGSVWATNRAGNSVVHVGLVENGQCVDRNGNGVIDTSTGLGDVRAWDNAGGANTNGGVSTALDECLLHYVRVSSSGTRHVSVTADNDVWVSGTGGRHFDLIDGASGEIVRREQSVGYGGYGGLIDPSGVIWSSRPLLRWDTANPLTGPNGGNWRGYSHDSYGLCIDPEGNVWNTEYGSRIHKFAPDGTLIGTYNHGGSLAQGCVADRDGHIWVAHSLSGNTVGHLRNDGTHLGNVTVGSGPTGVAVDGAGKIWATNYSSRTVSRIDPDAGPIGTDGQTRVGAVDFTSVDLGGNLYNYSDMTGSTLAGAPDTGTWSVVYDSGVDAAQWGRVAWTAQVPGDGSLTVTAASSENGSTFSAPVDATSGGLIDVPDGRYLRVTVSFKRSSDGDSPVLNDLTVRTGTAPLECETQPGGIAPSDVAFVLDESGSMSSNDPQRIRVSASTAFVDRFVEGDRAAVIGFESSARVILGLSSDVDAIKAALNQTRASGGTDISSGVRAGLDELAKDAQPGRPQFLLLLSDGAGSYSHTLTDRAAAEGVTIYTVGLGPSVPEALLTEIAERTGGRYFPAARADELPDLFQEIRDETEIILCGGPTAEAGGPYAVPEGGAVILFGSADPGDDTRPLTFAWDLDSDGDFETDGPLARFDATDLDGPAEVEVALQVCDADELCDVDTATVEVRNVRPEVDAGPDLVVTVGDTALLDGRFSDPAGDDDAPYETIWTLDGEETAGTADHGDPVRRSVSFDSPQSHLAEVTVTDADGATGRDTVRVSAVAIDPDCSGAGPTIAQLWPPNHKLHNVAITGVEAPDGADVAIVITGIRQDEPVNSTGDGNTAPDAFGVGTSTASLRAERAGPQDSRFYHIFYEARTSEGGMCAGSVSVMVPHDRSPNAVHVDGGPIYDSTAGSDPEPGTPVALDGHHRVTNGATLTVDAPGVLAPHLTPDSEDVVAELVEGPDAGELDLRPDGSFTYTAPDAPGDVRFTYRARSGDRVSATGTVTIRVTAATAALHAPDRELWTSEDTPVSATLTARGSGAEDAVFAIVDGPASGTVELDGDVLTYKPARDFTGGDELTYSATSGGVQSVGTVRMTVLASNDTPVAETVAAAVPEDGTALIDVLSAASDADGDALEVVEVTAPAHGTAEVVDGQIRYEPEADYNGPDTFRYRVQDPDGAFAAAAVLVDVTEENDPPLAADLDYSTSWDEALSIPVAEVVAAGRPGPADEEGQALTLTTVTATADTNGRVTLDGDVITYTPDSDFSGRASFRYELCDDGTSAGEPDPRCAHGTITVDVVRTNRPPVAHDAAVTTAEDTPVEITLRATDANDDPLTYRIVTGPAHGNLTGTPPTLTYTPATGFSGTDTFTFAAHDGQAESSPATVTITVTEVNSPPVPAPDHFAIDAGEILTVPAADLTANDVPGPPHEAHQSLTVTRLIATSDTFGALSLADGVVTYTPEPGYSGTASFRYEVCDDGTTAGQPDPLCAEGTVTVDVAVINTPPTAAPVVASTDEDTPVVITLTGRDDDGDALTFAIVEGPQNGALGALSAVICEQDGSASVCSATVTYTPDPDVATIDVFRFAVRDGRATVEATASVYIEPVNDAPTADATPNPLVLAEDTQAGVTLTGADIETPPAALVVEITALPDRGELRHDGRALEVGDRITGVPVDVSYVPDPDANGSDGFTFRVHDDGQALSPPLHAEQAVTVSITPVNDPPVPGTFRASATQGQPLEIPAADVAATASPGPADEAGQALVITNVRAVDDTHGTVVLAGGVITYTPDGDHSGPASFAYTICDDGTTGGQPDPRCAEGVVSLTVAEEGPDLAPPIVEVEDVTVTAGTTAIVTVTATDNRGVASLELTVDGTSVPLDDAGRAQVPTSSPGVQQLVATATDAAGNVGTAMGKVVALGSDDGVAPAAAITAPIDGKELSEPTTVVGTATDARLSHWQLTATPVSPADSAPIVLAEGTEPIADGALGTFDPTTLTGGQYRLRLDVWDLGGRGARAEVVVIADNETPYGQFSMTFTDAVMPLGNFPVTVQRTYSSGSRAISGDFGYGWRLGLQSLKLEVDREPGDGWRAENRGTIIPNWVLIPTKPHTVTIVDDNRDSIIFEFTPTFISPILPNYATAAFTERTNKGATLTPLDATDLFFSGDQLYGFDTIETYHPQAYQLTLRDGRRYTFHLERGLTEYRDANGERLSITASGITSSRGPGVTFARDSEGRITSVTTPGGLVTRYGYDAAGNLAEVIDPEGNRTTFAYDRRHLLIGVVDALGRVPMRTEFDENGRIVAIVDSSGRRTELSSDPDAREETISDRLGNVTVRSYDEDGNVLKEIHPDGAVETFTYDADGNQTSRTDGLGRTTTYTYDQRGNRTSQTDELGNTTTYTYDEDDNLIAMVDPLDEVTTFTYDGNGNRTSVTYPDGTTESWTYDSRGNLLTETDATGAVTRHTYDSQGRRISTVLPGGAERVTTYDADGRRASQTGPSGTETFGYDGLGNITTHHDPLGGQTLNTYDPLGRRTEQVDPLGGIRTKTYDEHGNVVAETDATGAVTRHTYDAEGRKLSTTDPDGTVHSFTYDRRGREIARRVDGVIVEERTYDAAGQITSITDAAGAVTRYEYDRAGRLVRTIFPDGSAEELTLDGAGNVLERTTPDGTTTFTYDERGRMRSRTVPGRGTTTYDYDADGRLKEEIGPDGRKTTYTYGADHRLASVTDGLGGVTTFSYDGDGRLTSVTDPLGRTTTYQHDARGHLTERSVEGQVLERYTADAMGRILTRTDADGRVTSYEHDGEGHLVAIDHADGRTTRIDYTDGGRRDTVTDARGVTSYGYDTAGRLVQVTAPEGTVSYAYRPDGNLASRTDPGGTTAYEYDDLGRLTAVVDPSGGRYTIGYDSAGRPSTLTYPNGVISTTTFDDAGAAASRTITGSGGQVLASFGVTRDAGGRLTGVEETGPGLGAPRSRAYAYDAAGRLTGATVTRDGTVVTDESYTLDAFGNRTAVTSGGTTQTATFDALDRITTLGDTTYTHDASGRRIRAEGPDGATSYAYDSDHRLIRVGKPDGTVVEHTYDVDGNRVATTVAGQRTEYVLDIAAELPQVVAETDGQGAVTATYVYIAGRLVAMRRGGVTTYVHDDHGGNIRLLTDATGAVTDTFDYGPFGTLESRTGTTPLPYGYRGQRYDESTGLYYLHARYYDPVSARFLSPDPHPGVLRRPASFNRYLYANGDPVNMWDPNGQMGLAVAVGGFPVQATLAGISVPSLVGVLATVYVLLLISGVVGPALVSTSGLTIGQTIANSQAAQRRLELEWEKLAAAIAAASAAAACGVPLFHYTSYMGARGILADQAIFATPTFRSPWGTHPSGAYATTIWPIGPTTRSQLQDLYKMGDRNWDVSWYVMLCHNQNPTFIPSGYGQEWYAPAPPGWPVPVRVWTIGPNLMLP